MLTKMYNPLCEEMGAGVVKKSVKNVKNSGFSKGFLYFGESFGPGKNMHKRMNILG